MATSFLPIILMFLGSSGWMNEVLDLTDPQSYLEAQGIEYTVEALVEVLAEPRSQDLEKIKAQEVKKLQAMRALGLLKDKSALPVLEKLADSKTLFFDDYARAAIAAIEGKPFAEPTASAAELKSDLALFPEGVGMVMQLRLDGGEPVDLKKLIAEAVKGVPGKDAPKPEELLKQMNGQIRKVLEKIGNARIDAVTVGVSDDVGDSSGFVMVIVRGKYDHRSFESMLAEGDTTHHQIGETVFLQKTGINAALAPVSSEHLIVVTGPGWDHFPLEKISAKLKERPAEPVFSERLKKVLAQSDQKGSIWGAGVISGEMKEAPMIAAFDQVVISTEL